MLRFISKLRNKDRTNENTEKTQATDTTETRPTLARELEKAELYWIKQSQKSLRDRLKKGELKELTLFVDEDDVIRVGGRVGEAVISYDAKHPVLLPREHWISLLITRYFHRKGHSGVATTVARTKQKYWIIRCHDLAKSVKFRCVDCRRMQAEVEKQFVSDLPIIRLEPHTPPFCRTACDYFGPYLVKVGRNKTTKHYGVVFTSLSTRAMHLEFAVDYFTMEFLQTLRRFFAIRGQPTLMISDNGTQLVEAERELREMIQGWDERELKKFSAEKGMEWNFITPVAPHHNGCAEAMVKP